MSKIRVVVADDHAVLRAGILTLILSLEEIEVVGEAGDGQEALELVEEHRPDVLITDIAMPRLAGLELTTRVSHDFPDVKTIVLSMHSEEEYVCKAFQAGAIGYLLKSADMAELTRAIQAVANGQPYLSPSVSQHVLTDYRLKTRDAKFVPELLTPRQIEILRLIASGHSTKAIARMLGISTKTVETHRTQLMERLDIHDVASLARYAIRTGLISSDE